MKISQTSPRTLLNRTMENFINECHRGPDYIRDRLERFVKRPGLTLPGLEEFAASLLDFYLGFKQEHPDAAFTMVAIAYRNLPEDAVVHEVYAFDPPLMADAPTKEGLRMACLLRGLEVDALAFAHCSDAWAIRAGPEQSEQLNALLKEGLDLPEISQRLGVPMLDVIDVLAESPGLQYGMAQYYRVDGGTLALTDKVILKTGDPGFRPQQGRFVFFPPKAGQE